MRRWALRSIVFVLLTVALVALAGSPSVASAEERPRGLAALEWTRGPGAEACLSDAEIVKAVEATLSRRVFAPLAESDRVLRASIAPATAPIPSGWHATIELSSKQGVELGAREIELEGTDCREASDVLVLAISLMADLPEVPGEREPPAPSIEPAPRPVRRPRPKAALAPPIRVRGSLAPAVVLVDEPAIDPGAAVSLEIDPPRFVPVIVDVLFQFQTRGSAGDQRYWLLGGTVALSICPVNFSGSRIGLLACIGPEATAYAAWARGFGDDTAALSSTFGGMVQARPSLTLTDELRVFLLVAAIGSPQRAGIVFADESGATTRIGRTSRVQGVFGLGLTLQF